MARSGWVIAFGLSALLAPPASAAPRYDGHAVVLVEIDDLPSLEALVAAGADVLDERPGSGPVRLRVPPGAWAQLDATGLPYTVLIDDLQPRVDAERARLAAAGPVSHQAGFFDDFRDFPTNDAHLDALASDFSDRVEIVDVGLSLEGRPIRGVSIYAGADANPPAVLITGTIHAREWLSTTTAMCIADTFAREDGTNAALADAIAAVRLIVVPVLNPDGYVWSWDVERYWRKNRRDGIGVDLNRNFAWEWGGPGSGSDPMEENYRGPSAVSEPESQAIASFMEARADLVAHSDIHTFGQLVLYPWGYSQAPSPDDDALSQLAQAQVDAMAAASGAEYIPLQGADLYPAAGVLDDWAYGELGLMSFAPELRPSFDGPGDFVVAPSEIGPACDENIAAALVLMQWASGEEPTPGTTGGPDTGDTTGDDPDTGDPDGTTGGDGPDPTADDDDDDDGDGTSGPTVTTTGTDRADTDDESGGDAGATEPGGCGCRSGSSPGTLWLGLVVLLALRRRSRIRAADA